MGSLGTMTAYVGLDYSDLQRGVAYSKDQIGGLQNYSANARVTQSRAAGGAAAGAIAASAMAGRSTAAAQGGLMRSTFGLVGSLARVGMTAASAYGGWRLHSLRMRNELLQNQILTRTLASHPGNGAVSWLGQMRSNGRSTQMTMWGLAKATLGVTGALTAIGAAAVYGYGAWRLQSARIKNELLQQKMLAMQLREMRSGGGAAGGRSMLSPMGLGSMALGYGVMSGVKRGVGLAAQGEQSQISFEVMLGSAEKAQSLLASLKQYANNSPFDVAGVNEAAQKLLNYNVQAQDVLPVMKRLGDVAAGDMEKFGALSTAFGQMTSTGRLQGQDLLQFINAGFNPLQEIAKKTGESMAALKKRMEEGGISAMEVNDAFIAATSAGGRFENMTARQAKTIAGRWSTMKDSIDGVLREIGESLITSLDLGGWLEYMTAVIDQVPFVFRNAGSLIQVAVLDWNIYLAQAVPGMTETLLAIGTTVNAVWVALTSSFHLFIDSVKAGLIEIMNLAQAAAGGVSAAANGLRESAGQSLANVAQGVLSGNGITSVAQEAWNWSPGAALTSNNGVLANLSNGFNATLAGQQDAMQPGTDFASTFAASFGEQMAQAATTTSDGYLQQLQDEKERILNAIVKREEDIKKPQVKLEGKEGASFNSSTKDDGKDKSKGSADSSAALIASTEAAKILTRGASDDKQLTVLKSIDKKLGGNPLAPRPSQFAGNPLYSEVGVF